MKFYYLHDTDWYKSLGKGSLLKQQADSYDYRILSTVSYIMSQLVLDGCESVILEECNKLIHENKGFMDSIKGIVRWQALQDKSRNAGEIRIELDGICNNNMAAASDLIKSFEAFTHTDEYHAAKTITKLLYQHLNNWVNEVNECIQGGADVGELKRISENLWHEAMGYDLCLGKVLPNTFLNCVRKELDGTHARIDKCIADYQKEQKKK